MEKEKRQNPVVLRSKIFDNLAQIVDRFLTDCIFDFDSEGSMKVETGPLVEALEIVAPGYFERLGEFTDEIVGKGKKRRLDLEEKHTELIMAERQVAFLLGLIFSAHIVGAGPEGIQRLKAGYGRMGDLPAI